LMVSFLSRKGKKCRRLSCKGIKHARRIGPDLVPHHTRRSECSRPIGHSSQITNHSSKSISQDASVAFTRLTFTILQSTSSISQTIMEPIQDVPDLEAPSSNQDQPETTEGNNETSNGGSEVGHITTKLFFSLVWRCLECSTRVSHSSDHPHSHLVSHVCLELLEEKI